VDGREAGRRAPAGSRCASRIGDDGAGRAVGDLRHAAELAGRAISLQLRLVSGPRLQADAGRQGARLARKIRTSDEAVRLDPRDRLPERERDSRGRAAELARAEDHDAPAAGEDVDRSERTMIERSAESLATPARDS